MCVKIFTECVEMYIYKNAQFLKQFQNQTCHFLLGSQIFTNAKEN